MNDADLPVSFAWRVLHDAAWAAGWSLSGANLGVRAGWRYEASRGSQRRQWGTAREVTQWIAGGCAPLSPLTFISLFAGIGGMDLGLERAGLQCVAQVEIDDYAQRVLAKHWPAVPRFGDVRDCGAHNLPRADLLCGGFPCQDISNAGKRVGLAGERSGLWREFARLIGELQPRYVLVENVAALLNRGLSVVLGDLAALGFDAEWHCIPAAAVGAPHIRDRVFILAYAQCPKWGPLPQPQGRHVANGDNAGWQETASGLTARSAHGGAPLLADTDARNELWRGGVVQVGRIGCAVQAPPNGELGRTQWGTESCVGRALNGLSRGMDRPSGLTDEPHKRIITSGIDTLGDIRDADATQARAGEVLRDVRGAHGAQDDQWQAGGLRGLSAPEVLQPDVCEHPEAPEALGDAPLAGAQAHRDDMRGVQGGDESPGSSHRPEPREQRPDEYSDALQDVSRLLARDGKAPGAQHSGENAGAVLAAPRIITRPPSDSGAWSHKWEEGVSRVAHGVPRRVDRLRGLGNAVVPQVAEFIGTALRQFHEAQEAA